MFSANLQHFIDQHPMLFVAIFPFYFIIIWLLVGAINSSRRWFAGEVYPPGGIQWGEMEDAERTNAVAGNYNNMLTFGVSRQGLFGQHVPLSVHAPSIAHSMERDQGAEE